ncbi:hypothetical protein BH20VER2_BH20VER2_07680 [soil metagenome]
MIRPIRTDEGPTLLAALQRLAPESRVRRFLYDKRSFSEAELHELTHCDGVNHIALVAAVLDDRGAEVEPVAVGRAIRSSPDSDCAEAAFVTADEWQRHGVGKALVQELARRSQQVGIRRWRRLFRRQQGRETAPVAGGEAGVWRIGGRRRDGHGVGAPPRLDQQTRRTEVRSFGVAWRGGAAYARRLERR